MDEWISKTDAMKEFAIGDAWITRLVKRNSLAKKYEKVDERRQVFYRREDIKKVISATGSAGSQTELIKTKKHLRQLQREEDSNALILRTIKSCIQAIPISPAPKFCKGTSKPRDEVVVAQLSDMHIGEVVDPLEVYGLNAYNFDIFKCRLQCMVDTIIHICFDIHKGQAFQGLVINALGDMVSGYIHEELEITGDGNMIQWVFGGAYVLAQATLELAALFPFININCVVGNHGRLQKQKRFKRRYVNWDTVFYEAWAAYAADAKNVNFIIPRSFFMTTVINENRCVLLHGDDIRSWMGRPYYGIDRAARNFTQLMRTIEHDFNYFMLAHFHESAELQNANGEILINGSFIGGGEYSIGRMGVCAPPRQLVFGMGKAGMSFSYKIGFREKFYPDVSRYKYNPEMSIAEQRR